MTSTASSSGDKREKRGASDAAHLLRADIEKVFPPPPTQKGVFARHVPHDKVVVEDRDARAMRHLAEEIEQRTMAVEKMHADTGARIDAWQELPKESALAVAEARDIAQLMDAEIRLIEALKSSLGRALHAAKGDQLAAAKKRIESLKDEVERWQRDAEADKQALLVHGRAVLERKQGPEGQLTNAVVEIPLPVQAQRAMADAIQRRSEAEGSNDRLRDLIVEEQRIQVDLEKRLGQALDEARESMADGVNDLRASLDAVRAWGHSLAFEARRFKKIG